MPGEIFHRQERQDSPKQSTLSFFSVVQPLTQIPNTAMRKPTADTGMTHLQDLENRRKLRIEDITEG